VVNVELSELRKSPSNVRVVGRGPMAKMWLMRNVYTILMGKALGESPLARPRRRYGVIIKVDLRDIGCQDGRCMELALNCVQRQTLVLAFSKLRLLLPRFQLAWRVITKSIIRYWPRLSNSVFNRMQE